MNAPHALSPAPRRVIALRLAALLVLFGVLELLWARGGIVSPSERVHLSVPLLWLAWTLGNPARRRLWREPRRWAVLLLIIGGFGVVLFMIGAAQGRAYDAGISVVEVGWRIALSLSLVVLFGRLHAVLVWLLRSAPLPHQHARPTLAFAMTLLVFVPYSFAFWSIHRVHLPNAHDPRDSFNLPFENVEFAAADDGARLSGWLVPGAHQGEAVIVCHGIGANRSIFRDVIPFLHREGASVLMFDFRGHGASSGHTVTFGHDEARDVRGAFAFLKRRGFRRIALYGWSMGGAACVLAVPQLRRDPALRGAVIDSSFADFGPLLRAQTATTPLIGRAMPFLTRVFGFVELGFDADEIAPRRVIAQLSPRPLLLVHGLDDRFVPVEQARWNFAAAKEPKALWLVPRAAHCLTRLANVPRYEARVGAFFRRYLAP